MATKRQSTDLQEFSAAEITGLAHLYRGEVYRSTVWRTRLDTTTNWSGLWRESGGNLKAA